MATDREFLAMRGIKRHLDILEDDHQAQNRVINWVVDKVSSYNKSLSGPAIMANKANGGLGITDVHEGTAVQG